MRLLAIDPGNTESAFAYIDPTDCSPRHFGKIPNAQLYSDISRGALCADYTAIEMIASYGMPVGQEVFDTCVWIGRYAGLIEDLRGQPCELIKRQPVRLHHCHSTKATDATVTQALRDRFAYGQPNYGKGTKTAPGWFYGFKADIWQAYALAVYAADQLFTRSLAVAL